MDDENNNSVNNSQTMSLRIQKKIASKLSTKNVAKMFIDETTGRLLDNIQRLVKEYTNSKKQAEAILKDMIKIIVKIGILTRNEQFNEEELRLCGELSQNMITFVKTTISYYEIEHTFDVNHILNVQIKCHALINTIIKRHLTEKTMQRVDRVYELFESRTFWEDMFKNKPKYRHILVPIIQDAKQLLDNGAF